MAVTDRVIGDLYLLDATGFTNLVTRVKDAQIEISMETADNTAIRDRWKYTKPVALSASLSFTEAVENASGAGLSSMLQYGKKIAVEFRPYNGAGGEGVITGTFYVTQMGLRVGASGQEISCQMESYGEVAVNGTVNNDWSA